MKIKEQAKVKGHPVVGSLKRCEDDVFSQNGKEVRHRRYTDSEGTLYAVDWKGELVYIAGDDWCI